MEIMILTPDDQIIALKVHPSITVKDLKSELKLRVTLTHDGKEMMENSRRLSMYGVGHGDLVVMNYESPFWNDIIRGLSSYYQVDSVVRKNVPPSKTSGKELGFNPDGSAVDISAFRKHIVKNYDIMARIRMDYPELAEILDVKNKSTDDWLQSFLRTLHCLIAEWKRRPALHKSRDAKKIQDIPYVNPETRPRVCVEINGKKVQGVLVDTGASVCTITRACAVVCGLRKLIDETKNEPLTAMDGTSIPVVGLIKKATVKIGDITRHCSFEVVKSEAEEACLLGMGFLRKNKCIIDLEANVLRIPGSSPVPFLPDDSSDQDSVSKSSDSKGVHELVGALKENRLA